MYQENVTCETQDEVNLWTLVDLVYSTYPSAFPDPDVFLALSDCLEERGHLGAECLRLGFVPLRCAGWFWARGSEPTSEETPYRNILPADVFDRLSGNLVPEKWGPGCKTYTSRSDACKALLNAWKKPK